MNIANGLDGWAISLNALNRNADLLDNDNDRVMKADDLIGFFPSIRLSDGRRLTPIGGEFIAVANGEDIAAACAALGADSIIEVGYFDRCRKLKAEIFPLMTADQRDELAVMFPDDVDEKWEVESSELYWDQ